MKVNKTIKLYIGGKFPRTESGRSFELNLHKSKDVFARICQSTRKDFRNSVEVARKAQGGWEKRDAFNRSQILYRAAEMMEGKRDEFIKLFCDVLGYTDKKANDEFDKGRDAWVYYAGFCDKYTQILGAVNPVSGPFHHFSTPCAQGVVMHFDCEKFSFERLNASIASVIATGNSVITLLGEQCPAVLAPLAEVLATSDLPCGVVNLLTGFAKEIYSHVGLHRDVNGILFDGADSKILKELKIAGADNMKRIVVAKKAPLSLDRLAGHTEIKSVWHPTAAWVGSSGSY